MLPLFYKNLLNRALSICYNTVPLIPDLDKLKNYFFKDMFYIRCLFFFRGGGISSFREKKGS